LSLPDEAHAEESGRVWIPPVPNQALSADIRRRAESLQIVSVPILGYWIRKSKDLPAEERPYPGEKVLLNIHGGGYVCHTAHSDGPLSVIPKGLLERCQSIRRALSIEYRLSTGAPLPPTNQFPAALLDVLAGYMYLVEMGFKAKDIIVVGDSAGGNAGLALTRYLVENYHPAETLRYCPPPPGSLLLLSPWADISESFRATGDSHTSQVKFAQYDFLGTLNKWFPLYCATAFVGARPEDRAEAFSNRYISPASQDILGLTPGSSRTVSFKGFPRTWIEVGGFETLLDQVRRLKDVMVEDMGKEMVEYHEVDGVVHDHLSLDWHEPDRTESLILISAWLEKNV
jgi:acetyl esterase/lipase